MDGVTFLDSFDEDDPRLRGSAAKKIWNRNTWRYETSADRLLAELWKSPKYRKAHKRIIEWREKRKIEKQNQTVNTLDPKEEMIEQEIKRIKENENPL